MPSNKDKLKCLLFDLDDTLVISDPLRISALMSAGHPNPKRLSLKTLRFSSPLKLLKPHVIVNMEAYWAAYILAAQRFARLTDKQLPRVLSDLKESSIKIGVVTSQVTDTAYAVLKAVKLVSLFDDCIVGYDVHHKSKEYGIRRAMRKLKVPAQQTAYVGDSENDYKASEQAGIRFYLADWGYNTVASNELKANAYGVLSKASELLKL